MIAGMGISLVDPETGDSIDLTMDQLEEKASFQNELMLVALKKEQKELENSNAPEIHKVALSQAVQVQSCLVDFNKYMSGQTYNPQVALGKMLLGLAAAEAKRNYADVIKHNPL